MRLLQAIETLLQQLQVLHPMRLLLHNLSSCQSRQPKNAENGTMFDVEKAEMAEMVEVFWVKRRCFTAWISWDKSS